MVSKGLVTKIMIIVYGLLQVIGQAQLMPVLGNRFGEPAYRSTMFEH